jgi:predicted nucleic acid-binding protein
MKANTCYQNLSNNNVLYFRNYVKNVEVRFITPKKIKSIVKTFPYWNHLAFKWISGHSNYLLYEGDELLVEICEHCSKLNYAYKVDIMSIEEEYWKQKNKESKITN